jgi:hypothetical protein
MKPRNASFDSFACVLIFALSTVFIPSAPAVDITFFHYSDPHYGARTSRDDPTPITRSPQVDVINNLPGTAYPPGIGGAVDTPRGILMPGDLIDNGAVEGRYQKEWADFVADFGVNGEGRCKFRVFEGVGNHDVNLNLYVFNQVKRRTLIRKQLGYIGNISSNGYHYSWDWDGVHFVNVNLFPGNIWEGEADAYGRGHDPLFARDFLEEDLRKNVGNSGRPVVIMQHFRPVDENWWTHIAADRFHRVIQDYNVIAILVGHQGGGVNNSWRGIHWVTSNGRLVVWRVRDNELVVLERLGASWGTPVKRTIYHAYDQSGLPAVVNNGTWVTDLTATSATLSGRLVYEAGTGTEVTVYWGTTDGGTQADAWQYSKRIGVLKAGETGTIAIDGLQPWTDYFYRAAARNDRGHAWAAASIPFSTAGELPDGWKTETIGYEQRAGGGANFENGLFTVRGSGRDIAERGQPIDNLQIRLSHAGGRRGNQGPDQRDGDTDPGAQGRYHAAGIDRSLGQERGGAVQSANRRSPVVTRQ